MGFAPRILFSYIPRYFMTRDNKQNLERKLDHLINLIDMLVDQYPHITCSERASMLVTLSMAAKQVAKNVGIVRETILIRLIDEFGVEYSEYARNLDARKSLMIEKVAGAPMISSIDNMSEPITGASKILEVENRKYEVGRIKGLSRVDYFLQYFVENSTKVFDDILESLTLIISDLKGIDDEDYYALKDGRIDLQERYDHLYSQYVELKGSNIRKSVESKLSFILSVLGCSSQAIVQYMNDRTQDYDYITMNEIDGESAAKQILYDRKQITMDKLAQHFKNRMEWKILNEKLIEIQKAEDAGIVPPKTNNATVVIGTNVEKQINKIYINERQAN